MASERLRDLRRRLRDWRRRRRVAVLFGLNLLVSVAIGYLLEQLLLGTWSPGAWCLAALGAAAGFYLFWLWRLTRREAAQHGVLLNVAAGPSHYRKRREAEQATLSAWAANRYPTSVVMGPLMVELPFARANASGFDPGRDRALGAFGVAIADKVLAAAVLAPGARRFVILPAGVPEAVVQAAAGLWPLLGDSAVLASDVTGDREPEPFFTFRPPPDTGPGRDVVALDGASPMIGLLRERVDRGVAGANPVLVETPPAPLGESVVRFGQRSGDVGFVPEDAEACVAVLERFADQLPMPPASGKATLYVVSDAPEALVFGAGMVAARRGWQVGSAVYHAGTYSYPTLSQVVMPDMSELGAQLRGGTGTSGAYREWHRRLGRSSALLAIGVPLATGAVATLVEWGVARSQGPRSGALHLIPCWWQSDMCGVGFAGWFFAGLALGIGVGLVWLGSRMRRAIVNPAFVVDASRVFPDEQVFDADVTTRTIRAWRKLGTRKPLDDLAALHARLAPESLGDWVDTLSDDDAWEWNRVLRVAGEPYVDWIQARLVDILTAFPGVEKITLRIPESGFGGGWPDDERGRDLRAKLTAAVVRGVNTGFRGNQPLTLECGGHSQKLMPMAKHACQELAANRPEVMAAAIMAMSRM